MSVMNENGRRLLYSVNRAQAAAVNININYRVEKTSCVNPIGGPLGGSVKNGRRLLHSVNRARSAADVNF
jgi:hypothetical protein